MTSLRKNLASLFSGDLTRTFNALLHDNHKEYIDEKSYEKLVQCFYQNQTKMTKEQVCERLLDETSKQNTWSGALRCLMVIHKVIHELGCSGYDPSLLANSKKISKLSQFKSKDSSNVTLLHAPHVRYYFTYLQRLSYSYSDFQVCFFPDNMLPDCVSIDGLPFLHFLNRLQNMLEYIIQILPLFEVSFTQISDMNIVKQLAYFYLTDCFYFYNYLNQALIAMLKDIFKVSASDAVALYELYYEHVQLTKKLKDSFELSIYLDEFNLKTPSFFKVDAKLHNRMKEYVANIKSSITPSKTCVNKSGSNSPSRSLPGSPVLTFNMEQFDFKSPKNIARIISSINHPNKNNYIKDTGLFFQPPNKTRLIVQKSAPTTPLAKIQIIECKTPSPSLSLVLHTPGSAINIATQIKHLQVPSTADKNQFTTQAASFSFEQTKTTTVAPVHPQGDNGSLQHIQMVQTNA